MSWRTSYYFDFWNINASDPSITEKEADKITAKFRKFSETAKEALTPKGGCNTELSSWPELKKELTEFSLKYPQYVFEISGSGEEHLDEWRLYACNGKSYHVQTTIPEFDFDKLR